MASSFTQSTIQSTVAQQSSQAATVLQARQPEVVLARPTRSWGCRRAARRCISILKRGINKPSGITGWPPPSRGDLETLPQQALARNRVASSIKSSTSSGGDLESLPEQLSCVTVWPPPSRAPPALHDLMACSFTQSTTQSTVAQQSSQEPTVLQARRPEALWAWPSCQEMHFNTNERPQQAIHHNHVASSMGISISSGRDLETLPQQALPHNGVASSIKSSTSSETLAQQALQCNCVVAAYISNKDLETLILQALQHDLMASSFTQSTTQSTLAQQSSQEATVLQARQPKTVLAGQQVAGAAAMLPGDAFQY
ncbi:hypothetical protein AAY473_040777 [Plecturocebus cupreus]